MGKPALIIIIIFYILLISKRCLIYPVYITIIYIFLSFSSDKFNNFIL